MTEEQLGEMRKWYGPQRIYIFGAQQIVSFALSFVLNYFLQKVHGWSVLPSVTLTLTVILVWFALSDYLAFRFSHYLFSKRKESQ